MNEIITGDCLPILKTLESESVDLLVTDPPYGYSFMGKDWDKAVPSVDIWKECLRVLKPGAFAFVMSAPRQDVLSQMIVRLGMAGFDTGFTSIYWTYASGFPKAANVGKLVDKRLGAEREVLGYRHDGVGSISESGCYELNNAGSKMSKDVAITAPATPQAKALDGSYAGFQPKPAVEVIIVAMKPLSEKTYVDQALANGKGITWLDDCRIPYQNESDKEQVKADAGGSQRGNPERRSNLYGGGNGIPAFVQTQANPQGRFPANLLVSDDILNDGRITGAGFTGSGRAINKNKTSEFKLGNVYGKYKTDKVDSPQYDSGSYSRYFDLDKWAEKTLPFLIVPKASKNEKDKGLEDVEPQMRSESNKMMGNAGVMKTGSGNDRNVLFKNNHPTVKPLKLMSYLITMGSRKDDVILDPFSGSGTTCIAAKTLGRRYLGIELSEEYAATARKRLEAVTQLTLT